MQGTFYIFDEWQMAPVLWDAVRFEVDKRGDAGQFILTGSAVPADNVTAHTGTGRFSRMLMRPMSLFESNESDISISDKTISSYLNALRRIFVVEDLPAWLPSMRSKTAIRTSSKRHFVDPSIATAVLRTNPEGLLNDFKTFGFLFESLYTRDIIRKIWYEYLFHLFANLLFGWIVEFSMDVDWYGTRLQ